MRTPEENRQLCDRYPFLDCGDESYETTWADDMPEGWWSAFGEQLCDEIKKELIKYKFLDEYKIIQVKEKYGMLRIYDDGIPEGCKVWDIIEKYSVLSENICAFCGKPDVPMMTWGWVLPMCYEHANNKEEYEECKKKQYPHRMPDFRKWSQYNKNGEWITCEAYIGDTADKIRRRWNANHTDG